MKCEAPEGHKSTDLVILFFTSGTTGAPKMVLLEAEYLVGHTLTGLWYQAKPGTLVLCMADLGWAKGTYGAAGSFSVGATLFVQPPPPGAFTPTQLIESLHRYPIETLCAPPTIYRALVTSAGRAALKKQPLKKLRHCVGAGEPLNPQVITDWREITGLTIRDGWGMSETVPAVANFEGIEVRVRPFALATAAC